MAEVQISKGEEKDNGGKKDFLRGRPFEREKGV